MPSLVQWFWEFQEFFGTLLALGKRISWVCWTLISMTFKKCGAFHLELEVALAWFWSRLPHISCLSDAIIMPSPRKFRTKRKKRISPMQNSPNTKLRTLSYQTLRWLRNSSVTRWHQWNLCQFSAVQKHGWYCSWSHSTANRAYRWNYASSEINCF